MMLMNMKNSVTIPKKTTKLKRLTLLLPFLLLAVALSSCSDDGNDENGDPQEEYTNYDYILTCDDGNQYYIRKLTEGGDSILFVKWLKKVPNKLVDKSQLPDWIMKTHITQSFNARISSETYWGYVYVLQGEDVDTGQPYYVSMSNPLDFFRYFYLLDHTGQVLNINQEDAMKFYNSKTKNWRCIYNPKVG